MLLPPPSGIEIMPICFIQITYLAVVTKSILLALILLNSLRLLHKYYDVPKSSDQMLVLTLSLYNSCFIIINTIATRPDGNDSGQSCHDFWQLSILNLVYVSSFCLSFIHYFVFSYFFFCLYSVFESNIFGLITY